MTVAQQVRQIIAEHLGRDEAKVTDDALMVDDLGTDSLDAVEMVMAFEEEFRLPEFDDNEFLTEMRVRDVIAIVERAIAAKARST